MTGSQMFAKLLELRDEAGCKHYDRVVLADKLLKDKGWVESADGGGGDIGTAMDRVEEMCFGDICGLVSLPLLLELYHNVPNFNDWKRFKFNVGKMWADWKAKQKPTPKKTTITRPPVEYVPPNQFEELTGGKARKEYGRVYNRVVSLQEKVTRLEEENTELKRENMELKDKLYKARESWEKMFIA